MTNGDKNGITNTMRLKRLGIDTYNEHVIFMHVDSPVCRSEGFNALTRVQVAINGRKIIATLHVTNSDLLKHDEASLSESAWRHLAAHAGDTIVVSHPEPVDSLQHVRSKVYGNRLKHAQVSEILHDIIDGKYTDVEIAAFLVACSMSMNDDETIALAKAMVEVGRRLSWGGNTIVDKHCVGGLPGNRTTLIVVPILAAAGLTIPKTSSRAITSPAGTADTMETLAPVDLNIERMRRVVEQEGGCVVWGGAVHLSPADDVMVRVERSLDIDSPAQLVASVLSKKAAAGSTHVLIDMPIGPTAKVRDSLAAQELSRLLNLVSAELNLKLTIIESDGRQPVGRGIGPSLEAFDVLAVLQNQTSAPADLRQRSLGFAGALLEITGKAASGQGRQFAAALIDNGAAWRKFQAICEAQGGMRQPQKAAQRQPVLARHAGTICAIDNRRVAKTAKLAGAPRAAAAGIEFLAPLGKRIAVGDPLFIVHAETPGELEYALAYAESQRDMIRVEET